MKKILETQKNRFEFKIILGLVLLATLTRIAIPPFLGHPPNFSAIDALALFCGAYFSRSLIACAVILLSVWVGDVFINKSLMGHWVLFYPGFYWQYGSYLVITWIGVTLQKKINPLHITTACLVSSCFFFAISNLGVWFSGFLYPLTFDGLIACYVSALPFFKNTILSDLFFSMVLFGSVEFIKMGYPNLGLSYRRIH